MGIKSLVKWICVSYIFQFVSCGLSIKLPISNSNKNPPEIILAGYIEADRLLVTIPDQNFLFQNKFQNDLISKNGNEYIVSGEVITLVFSCKASYPIAWTFPFKETLPHRSLSGIITADYRTSAFSADIQEPLNAQFQSLLIIHLQLIEFFSTNLTCQSLEIYPDQQSSIYVYLDGKTELENMGKTLNITYTPVPNQIIPLILPCRPSSTDLNLLLEIQQHPTQKWKPVTNMQMEFDPKVGFILPNVNKLRISRSYAIFRCSVVTDSDEKNLQVTKAPDNNRFVCFNVSSSNANIVESLSFQPVSILHGKASVEIENSQPNFTSKRNKIQYNSALLQTFVTCCSGVPQKPPILFLQNCLSPIHCEMQKQVIPEIFKQFEKQTKAVNYIHQAPIPKTNEKGCAKTWMHSTSGFAVCKGENVNFIQQYNQVLSSLSVGPVANRNKRFSSDNTTNAELGVSLTEHTWARNNTTLNQKMMLFVGRRVNKTFAFAYQTTKWGPAIVFEPKQRKLLDDLAIGNALTLLTGENIKQLSINIFEYNRDVYYEGEPLKFLCAGAKIFYARGPHLRVNWKNETKTVLQTGDDDDLTISENTEVLKMFHLSGGDSMFKQNPQNMEYAFTKTITATKGMSSVDCWLPPIGTSKWDKISKTLNVLTSVAPKFLEPNEETVYFYMGDKNNEVRCTIVQGLPTPIMTVLRDGKKQIIPWKANKSTSNLTDEIVNVDKNKMKFQFNFSAIQYGHQGMVECIAKNVNSTVTRTVHIFVIEKPSVALPISLSVVGVLSLVLVGLGITRWYNRHSVLS